MICQTACKRFATSLAHVSLANWRFATSLAHVSLANCLQAVCHFIR